MNRIGVAGQGSAPTCRWKNIFARARRGFKLEVPPALTDPAVRPRAAMAIAIRRCSRLAAVRADQPGCGAGADRRSYHTDGVVTTALGGSSRATPGRFPFRAARSIAGDGARSRPRCVRRKRRSDWRRRWWSRSGISTLPDGFRVRIVPTVARVKPDFALKLNPAEVDRDFEVPLEFLMTPGNHQRKSRDWNGISANITRCRSRPLHLGHHGGYFANLYDRIYGE